MQKPATDLLKVVKLRDNPEKYIPLLKGFKCGPNGSGVENFIHSFMLESEINNKTIVYLILNKETDELFGLFTFSACSFISDFEYDIYEKPIRIHFKRLFHHHPAILIDNYALDILQKGKIPELNSKITPYIFYEFIFPKIKEIQSEIGAEYIILFAADNSRTNEKKLINLYRNCGFESVNKKRVKFLTPYYDKDCEFMALKISNI